MRHEVAQLWINAYKEAPFIGRLQILHLLSLPLFAAGAAIYLTRLWIQL